MLMFPAMDPSDPLLTPTAELVSPAQWPGIAGANLYDSHVRQLQGKPRTLSETTDDSPLNATGVRVIAGFEGR